MIFFLNLLNEKMVYRVLIIYIFFIFLLFDLNKQSFTQIYCNNSIIKIILYCYIV